MAENKDRTCPFLTAPGCSVYPDRPDTCRMFPVEQGTLYNAETKNSRLIHFFRPPDFCLGKNEKRTWSTKTWSNNQHAEIHNKMTVKWAELKRLFQNDPWDGEGPDGHRGKMAFMASYNLDRFRDFVFNSSFLKRYKVNSVILKKIREDDVELMKLGFEWIKFFLWGIKTKNIQLK